MADLYPTPANITGIADLFSHADTVVNHLFGIGALSVVFVSAVLILIHQRYKASDSFAIASLITFLLGSFLWSVGLLLDKYIIIILVLFIISLIWTIFDNK